MKIVDLLSVKSIDINAASTSKQDALDKLIALMDKRGNLLDITEYKKCVLSREAEGSTGIGEGIAIPHAKTSAVKAPGLAAMVVRNGVDFESLDGEPARLFFLIAAPDTEDNVHLDVLSRLSQLLMNEDFRADLLAAKTAKEFLAVVDKYENAKADDKKAVSGKHRLLAVTACPTGIAHTYMAAEALLDTAEKMGVAMKVETNGSGGVKNKLTAEEIAEAAGIIVACKSC